MPARRARAAAVLGAAVRTYGAKGLVRRASYEARRRGGLLRRPLPGAGPLEDFRWAPRIHFEPIRRWATSTGCADDLAAGAVAAAERVLAGRACLYGGIDVYVGWPPKWHCHPVSGTRCDPLAHWTRLSDDDPDAGDIKDVWELSRLGAVFDFARAYVHTGEARWAEAFWNLLSDWCERNPAELGPNWMSGQEVALRGIAVMFGLSVFSSVGPSSAAARAQVGRLLHASASRVQRTIGYALSQRNNHAISESAFLWSLGALCPDLLGRRGTDRARRNLEEAVADQFLLDGSYAQHSFTYQRLAMHALLWTRWAAITTGRALPSGIDQALGRSLALLGALVEPTDGRAPNLGSNDGALLFRLSGTPIEDFRPVLAHTAAALGLEPAVRGGLGDEEAAWFGYRPQGRPARPTPAPRAETAYHVLVGPSSRALFRAGRLSHRPAHDDQLNLDLWIDGVNVARDPGTFRYSAASPWRNALAASAVHNVARPEASGAHSGRIGRFFWVSWNEGRVLARVQHLGAEAVLAEVTGQGDRSATRRLVARAGNSYWVLDRVQPTPGWVRWNLPPDCSVLVGDDRACISHPAFEGRVGGGGSPRRLVPDDSEPASGWESRLYGVRSPITSVIVPISGSGLAWACFAPHRERLLVPDASWAAVLDDGGEVALTRLLTGLA